MKLNEILASGLLELFVLGQLTGDELREVERAIEEFPEVKAEIFEIEKTLFKYDNLHSVVPPNGNLNKILSEINDGMPPPNTTTKKLPKKRNGFSGWGMLSALLGALFLGSIFYMINNQKEAQARFDEQTKLLQDCETEKAVIVDRQNYFAAILDYDSKKVIVAATEKYPETALVIHTNNSTKKNYLQISELPALANNQSYQLWSLKGNDAPIPLDVFENITDELIEVGYVEGTNAYAITIEPRGGQDTPTLENLIGVFSIKS